MFTPIGAALLVASISGSVIIFAIIIIILTAVFKFSGGFLASFGNNWSLKERYYAGICFLPKAAV